MKAILKMLMADSAWAKDFGLLLLRVSIGLIYMRHGWPKSWSMEELTWLGQQMANIGVTFAPLMWGLAAACTHFFGGMFLLLGLGTRIACMFMAFTMFVAVMFHIKKGDPWGYISHPLSLIIVFLAIVCMGAGRFSFDWYWSQ